ncbi:MAG: copper oxidase [Pseudonocardiales bacterium]|nr:multicopper oxidase family protein [Actinomycetota bacterium]PZS13288.1 MAG: copper oxidase [Pseudonocardiales bacterium]
MTRAPIGRRRALGVIALGAVGVAAGTTGWVSGLGAPAGSGRLALGAGGRLLVQPAVLASRDGVLDVELTAAPGVALAGRDTSALGFNGTSPGPTLRVAPGDLLRIRLTNHLDAPTNLHLHGVHVSPQGRGDNPFLSIAAGSGFDYAYRIPTDHPTGTYWYHPHHHGYIADQLFGGLVGALLIEHGQDLPVAADRVLMITDTTLDAAGRVVPVGAMDKMMGRQGELVLLNGQHHPAIPATPGVAQRWRIINACTSRVLALRLEQHPLTQIAHDGVFLPAPTDRDQIVLAPAGRADVIVHPARAGQYVLVTDPYDRGSGMMGMMSGGATGPITLATLAVAGPVGSSPPLPATLPAPPVPQGPVDGQRALTFAMGMGGMGSGGMGGMGGMGMSFTIDGRGFDARRDDQTVRLGSTEDWTITNTSSMDHPFHLHVWRFHVLADSTGTPRTATFQDVVLIPARGWVRLRILFTDYPGRSVYHCHTADHEDAGMMGTLTVTT